MIVHYQKFFPFRSTISRFRDIAIFSFFYYIFNGTRPRPRPCPAPALGPIGLGLGTYHHHTQPYPALPIAIKNFRPFRSTINRFRDTGHFSLFELFSLFFPDFAIFMGFNPASPSCQVAFPL